MPYAFNNDFITSNELIIPSRFSYLMKKLYMYRVNQKKIVCNLLEIILSNTAWPNKWICLTFF